MTILLEALEPLVTDGRDDLDRFGLLGNASAETYAACYVAARQCAIEVADLLQIAISCDELMAFLVRRVLTDDHMYVAQRLVIQR